MLWPRWQSQFWDQSHASATTPSGFDHWAAKSYALGGSRTFILRGERSTSGCSFTHPAIAGPDDGQAREQRDIAIDTAGCRALVEEGLAPTTASSADLPAGTSTETLPSTSTQDRRFSDAIEQRAAGGGIQPESAINPDLPTYRHQKLWYEDIVGIVVNSIDTKIKYFWDGVCALGGTTVAPVTYSAGSGWKLLSGASNESETCAKYVGNAWASFNNYVFCATDGIVVRVDYYSDKVSGSYTGAISYTKSYSVSTSCAPLYFHQATGSWTP